MFNESSAKKHEFIGVVLLFVALLVFLCLISYSSGDPSFNTLSLKQTADNKAGRLGAYTSDLLYQTFGFTAFLFLVPLPLIGWNLVFGRRIQSKYLKTCGFFLLLSASATALQFFSLGPENLTFMPGGVIGVMLSDFLLLNLNRAGTMVVITGALLLGLLAATPWSLSKSFSRFSHVPDPDPPGPGLKERFLLWLRREKPKSEHQAKVNVKRATSSNPNPPALPPAPIKVFLTEEYEYKEEEKEEKKEEAIPVSPKNRYESNITPARPTAQQPPPYNTPSFELPPVDILNTGGDSFPIDETELMERAKILTDKCAEFDANGKITQIHPGPVVTTFEFKPDPGVKYSRITGLVDDLCLGIKAESLRIDRLAGKATIGIEVPNPNREIIMLRDLVESDVFAASRSKLTLALGKLINGTPYVTDLAKMPHLLIAGATGTGKSVALNCMITSILYKATPEEVRFIFIDPKCVELGIYTDIPHLLTPIVTDPGEAANALRWATNEMEIRYKKLARCGVRNIDQYNTLLRGMKKPNDSSKGSKEEEPEKPLPCLVLIIDELADLMLASSKEVETSISRLAAKARAVGIHLILATQRPSVDVITGVIKSNLPSRVAFKVASKVDSRTIIDGNGAELLLGNGDMLFVPPGTARLIRVHGAYVSENETQDIVDHLKAQGRPAYDESVLSYGADASDESGAPTGNDAKDSLYNDAVRVVISEGRASTSLLQRRLSIGYGRAAKLVDMMFNNGIVGPADGSKPREVLADPDFLDRVNELEEFEEEDL